MQEHGRSPDRPGIDRHLADRLDRMSRQDAERVLESAIRLQTQRHSSEGFTADQIRRIAYELGLEDGVVDRAIHDELAGSSSGDERSWLVVTRVKKATAVAGPKRDVEERIASWMENEEGLRPVSRVRDGMCWEKDSHWLTSTRLALGSDATKALRDMSAVVHRLTPLGDDEHLVEIEVDTRRIAWTAWGLGGGLTAAGVGGGALAAGLVPGGSDLLQFLAVAGPGLAVAATSAAATARIWAESIRRGVDRALSGIAHPELHSRAARRLERRRLRDQTRRERTGFQRLVDEAADAIDGLFD